MTIPKTEMGNVFDICQSLEMVIDKICVSEFQGYHRILSHCYNIVILNRQTNLPTQSIFFYFIPAQKRGIILKYNSDYS